MTRLEKLERLVADAERDLAGAEAQTAQAETKTAALLATVAADRAESLVSEKDASSRRADAEAELRAVRERRGSGSPQRARASAADRP